MKKLKSKQKIYEAFASDELARLQDIIIFQNSDGSYSLYNKYIITPLDKHEFVVTAHNSGLEKKFNMLKNATAWCVYDKLNKFSGANRIQELDGRMAGADVDFLNHQRLFKKATSQEDQLIFAAKMTEDRSRKNLMLEELQSYTSLSKNWQIKRFMTKPEQ